MASPDARREAAACVERGIERYAEGQLQAAQRELEAALALAPGHTRALECLSWVRDIAAGRRTPSSDSYSAVAEGDISAPQPLTPTRAGVPTTGTRLPAQRSGPRIPAQKSQPKIPAQKPETSDPKLPAQTGNTTPGISAQERAPGPVTVVSSVPPPDAPLPTLHSAATAIFAARGKQTDDAPDSVTREWSSMATTNSPTLDMPELSEEQIANLLDLDRGQGITLSAGALSTVTRESSDEDADDDDAIDRTNVRTPSTPEQSHLVEFEAEPTPPPGEPALTPLASSPSQQPLRSSSSTSIAMARPSASTSSSAIQARTASSVAISSIGIPAMGSNADMPKLDLDAPLADQTSDDPSSLPTNPFVQHQLASLAPLLSGPSGLQQLDAAMRRGDSREIFDLAEQLAERGAGGRADEELLERAYEHVVGSVDAIPRFGKTSPDLDSRSAFLLSRIDGAMTIDDLLDVSGMPRRDALRVLARLIHVGAIVTR